MLGLTFFTSHDKLPRYLAVPVGAGPWSDAVVIHEAFGLTDGIRRIAGRFAAHGSLAFMAEPPAAGSPGTTTAPAAWA